MFTDAKDVVESSGYKMMWENDIMCFFYGHCVKLRAF